MLIEQMRASQPKIAGYLDKRATAHCEFPFGGSDERASNALTARAFSNNERGEPSHWRWPVEHGRDVDCQ